MQIDLLTTLTPSIAYIGPGGGIALLGPLFGVLAAVVAALGMIAIWPLRTLWKKLKASKSQPPRSPQATT